MIGAPACPLRLAENRGEVEGDAWLAALWRPAFAAMDEAARDDDWPAAASLFVRRANQHGWSDADIGRFANSLTKCR
jgi:hypothetical protein